MDNIPFSLPFCLEVALFDRIVADHPWVSLLGLGLWWFGWSGIMARGSLSSSCSCWGADHSSLDHCGSGDGGIGDGGYR